VLHASDPGNTQMTWSFDFSREGVRQSFETSLARLGVDDVDILYMHDPDNHYEQALTEALPVLAELRAQGRVKAIGAGMNQWEMELQFANTGQCDCFLLAGRYTLLDQSALPEFLPYAWNSTSAWSPVAHTIAAYLPLVHGRAPRSTTALPQLK
jgi:D-threo-aldose 1-dehydrogenase